MSRTKRKPRTGSGRFDPSCRNHGGCSYCRSNRTGEWKDSIPDKKKTNSRWKKGLDSPDEKFRESFEEYYCHQNHS